MKETMTINISGIVFHIDLDAYEKLKSYLNKITTHFSNEEGGHEIINDIESRIAELFSERTFSGKSVINESMVNGVIEIMGLPEDFNDEKEEENERDSTDNSTQSGFYQSKRKLYRDPESRVLGGVCSGLGHYMNLDKVLVRVLFVIILLVTSGVALPVYLILWIAVPKARTTSQKLEMKGEPITVENIGKSVKEEFNEMKDSFSKHKDSKEYKKAKEYTRKAGHAAHEVGKESVNVISKIFGAIFLLFGFIALISLVFGMFATTRIVGIFPGFDSGLFLNHVYSGSLASTLLFSILIIIGIPILLIIYAGTKMLFNYVANSRPVFLTALGVWVIGIIIAISTSAGAIDVFSTDASSNELESLTFSSDTIFIELDENEINDYNDIQIEVNNFKLVVVNNEEILVSRPKFTITSSNDDRIALKIRKYSKGNNYRTAKSNAENLTYSYRTEGSTLKLDPYFLVKNNGKWRNQKVKLNLNLPEGKVVYIDYSLLPIVYDIKNTNNTWDGDMPGQFWEMKHDGLTLCN